MEPPFRILAKAVLKARRPNVATRALWDISPRPPYLLGLHAAALQAQLQQVQAISAIEFGVAGGDGLVILQTEAEVVERETGVQIRVFGFDMGAAGLPAFIGDHRDHPDAWRPGDFPMDEQRLQAHLTERTTLILGDIATTVPAFTGPPIGFVAVDVDLYSSARDALRIFASSPMLWHVPIYFDDIEFMFNHRWAGELLAIEEFNEHNERVKIDSWYGLRAGRPFPDRTYLDQMRVAHDLTAIAAASVNRTANILPLR